MTVENNKHVLSHTVSEGQEFRIWPGGVSSGSPRVLVQLLSGQWSSPSLIGDVSKLTHMFVGRRPQFLTGCCPGPQFLSALVSP